MSMSEIQHWHLRMVDPAKNSKKFYRVSLTQDGIVVLHWGRIGTSGQAKVERRTDYEDGKALALRQVYAKREKGYEQAEEGRFVFNYDQLDTLMPAQEGTSSAAQRLADTIARNFQRAIGEGELVAKKDHALKVLDDFIHQAQIFIESAQQRDDDEELMETYSKLQDAWSELSDRYDTAQIAMQMAQAALQQRLGVPS